MEALPHVLLLLASAGVLLACAWAWRRSSALSAPYLVPFLLAAALWSFASAAETASSSFEWQFFWARLAYLGIVAVAPFWLLFCVAYTDRESWLGRWRVALLFVVPAVTFVLVWTNQSHFLFWRSVSFRADGALPDLVLVHGPAFWAWASYAWLLALTALLVLLRQLFSTAPYYRPRLWVLIGAMVPAVLVNLLYLTGLNPLRYGDPSGVGFALAALVVSWGLARYRLLDITPVAYEAVFSAIGDGVVVLDREASVVDVNAAARRFLMLPPDATPGLHIEEVLPAWSALLEPHEPEQVVREELEVELAEGTRRIEINVFPLFDGRGQFGGRVVIIKDVSERSAYQAEIEHMAYHDALTGLPNRYWLAQGVEKALALARRQGRGAAMLFLDLDRFKVVNDALGHAAGDLLLQNITARLQSVMRAENLLVRLGGDEFAILVQDSDERAAQAAAERFQRVFEDPFELRGNDFFIRATIGIALYPEHGTTEDELLSRADVAMYQAKRAGRRVGFFDAQSDTFTRERLELEAELRHALATDQLVLHYQPVMDLTTGEVPRVEALVRWDHPERGLLSPDEFLGLAQERGLAVELDRLVLRKALAERPRRVAEVAVNLLPETLQDEGFAGFVREQLARHRMSPRSLSFEITENALIQPERAAAALARLKDMGVQVAADDFGTGYSSLSYLRHFPLDALKISPHVVAGIGRRPEDEAIVLAILNLAMGLKLTVIAEGVDRAEQLRWLRQRGCRLVQGYAVARPVAAEELSAELTAGGMRGRLR